jgi:Xaa-Pro aminopeptidase
MSKSTLHVPYGTQGMMQVDYEKRIDFDRMRSYRVDRIKTYMDTYDIDCLLLFESGNKRYATATAVSYPTVDNMARYAIVPRGGEPHIFGFGSEVLAEKLNCPWLEGRTYPAHSTMLGALPMEWKCYESFLGDLKMVLDAHGLDTSCRLGIDSAEAQIVLALQEAGYPLADGQAVMQNSRAIKNEDEIAILKHAAAIADAAHHAIAKTIEPGVKENDLQGAAAAIMYKHGSQYVHNVQVTSGNRTHPHPHLSSDRLLQPGDLVFVDIVHLWNGYHTCYYRCFCVGDPTQKQLDIHKRCLEYQLAGLEAVKPGVTTADIASVWPTAKEMGYEREIDCFGLQFGHGIGVGLWEFPIISRAYSIDHPIEIRPGMVFAVETYAGEGYDGVRLEDEVVVTAEGTEIITKFPNDKLIGCGMHY